MGTELYFFSGTGNSLHIARELQRRLPESELIPILRALAEDRVATKGEAVGFVFPQYASTAPKIVMKLLEKFDFGSASYIFAVSVRGGTDCWTFSALNELLTRKGKRLDGNFAVTMPSGSAPLIASLYRERISEEKNARLEAKAMEDLDLACEAIRGRTAVRPKRIDGPTHAPALLLPFVPFFLKFGKYVESRFDFYADSKCTGCGLCEGVCLAGKVEMLDGRPNWKEEADFYACWACFNYCPALSIQIKSKWYLRSDTPLTGRCHHPQVTPKDIAAQKPEKRG